MMKQDSLRLQKILVRALDDCLQDDQDIRFLLSLTDDESLAMLFHAAREVRNQHFGARVFLYGFIYFSTFCHNDCRFCNYRRSNITLERYRKTSGEIIASAEKLTASGVHLIDLTMGELSERQVEPPGHSDSLVEIVRIIKARCHLPVMVSPGVVSNGCLRALSNAGANWYACYQETHNPRLFAQMRVGQSFEKRMEKKRTAQTLGMMIEEGIMIGIGESVADVADSIAAMGALDADQLRVMTFVPQEGTPMEFQKTTTSAPESVVIAVLRLVFPDRLIPASLDVRGLAGLAERLNAGANVVTSLVVPGMGLSGVANRALDIEQARRTPQAIETVLDQCGMAVASLGDYQNWIDQRQSRVTAKAI